jgi:signal transduction histidine kinase
MGYRDRTMANLVARTSSGHSMVNQPGGSPAAEPRAQHPLFAAHPVAALLYGRDGIIAAANAAALRLFRCGTAQLVGAHMASFLPELRKNLAVSEGVTHGRVAVRRPDGNNFVARVHFVPGEDAVAPLLATLEDLSEFEQEIAAANKELESFMSVASHDLRAPLRILKGFTDALDDECGESLSDEGRNFLKEILRAADRMDGLIEGLLALSRAGRAEMTCENIDISTLAELAMYELRHEKDSQPVEVHVEPGMQAWGDVRLMMVVLRNLFGNAWKFSSRAANPAVRFHREERGDRTWFCVTDNGAGFDMAHAARLFEPFSRLHRQDEFAGNGLGLATVRRILRRHGGDIEAESAVNLGARFRFWLKSQPQD